MSVTIYGGKSNGGLFVTNENAAARRQAEKKDSGNRKTIFAGDLAARPDSIMLRKKQAQKQAMKVLQDTFDVDKKMDLSMEDMTARQEELREKNLGYQRELEQISSQKQELMKAYGITEDSEEIPEEYQQRMQELEENETMYRGYIEENNAAIKGISISLSDTKIERLKEHPMLDAAKQSEEILQAASREIYGELINEGRKHLEEKMEEEKEKAEKRAEKKEEQEERLEKAEERKESLEKKTENDREMLETIRSYNEPDSTADKEIQEILEELKLIKEDIKGAAVDQNI